MKLSALLDATTASALDAAWLHAHLQPLSEAGLRAYARLEPFRPGDEKQAAGHAQQIAAHARAISPEEVAAMREALGSMPDALAAISRAAMGGVLEDAALFEMLRFLDAVRRLHPHVSMGEGARAVHALLERGRAGKFGFYLSDKFDDALAQARAAADAAQAEYDAARGRLAQRIAAELGRDEIAGNEFIVMREGAARLPEGVRVVREAPTYFLCELELDERALDALSKRDDHAKRVAAIEESVRAAVSERVREHARELDALLAAAGDFDVALAQIRFAQHYRCIPAAVCTERVLEMKKARYLPLQEELEAHGRRYEAISIRLSAPAVLTGPNMGGKSAALRTCGFIALLASFGLPVPAQDARCALFERIAWLGIGAQDETGGLLSSFAREVVRLQQILAGRSTGALLLVDEFARTTTPSEGKALLVALIRALGRRGSTALVATHLAGVAAAAGVRHFAVRGLRNVPSAAPGGDLAAALASLADSMDYAVVEVGNGGARTADALALALLLGLDADIVAEAADLLGGEAAT